MSDQPVLQITDLTVRTPRFNLLRDIGFTINADERVGLIGESGSGKSLTALAIMGLLSEGLSATGSITVADNELLGRKEADVAQRRGLDFAMVFQEPMTALNPTMRVGKQIAEIMLIHKTVGSKQAAHERAVQLLEQVELPDPQRAARAYPHELSGGQRQRAMIAIAMANDPSLLICDEPTTALDVTVQAQVLDVILKEADRHNAALLFITHDLAVVALMCQRVLVMYGGRIVEAGPAAEIFTSPHHPYTAGLLGASDITKVDQDGHLMTIPGNVPPAGQFPDGCVFVSRCDYATEMCSVEPPWTVDSDTVAAGTADSTGMRNNGYACHHPLGGSA
ncbi:MAG: ABC transporter ATP-binding protein [Antricoccus sp.]